MGAAVPGMALEQPGGGVEEEGQEQGVGFGEVEGVLEGASGGDLVAERVARDRLQQERPDRPCAVILRYGGGAVEDGRERGGCCLRVVLCEPPHRPGAAAPPG